MDNIKGRGVIYLVAVASIFVILSGIRASASIINPILLAAVITITVLPIPSRLAKRGVPGWLSLVLTILLVVLILGLVIFTVFFSVAKLSTELPVYLAEGSEQAAEDLSATENPTLNIQIEQVTNIHRSARPKRVDGYLGCVGYIRNGPVYLLLHDQRRPGHAHPLPHGPGSKFIDHRANISAY